MYPWAFPFFAPALLVCLTQCASEPQGGARLRAGANETPGSMARAVSLPVNLNGDEAGCLDALEDVLRANGFRPVQGPGGPYHLELHVTGSATAAEPSGTGAATPGATGEPTTGRKQLTLSIPGGPLRAVVTFVLRKDGRIVATAEGRFEGPRTEFTAERVVQGALRRALGAFSERLQAVNEMGTLPSAGRPSVE